MFFAVSGPDAVDEPFGALVHLDWLEMRRLSEAYRTTQRALIFTDDLTQFIGGFPSNPKTKDVVVEAAHRYDATPPAIRRWWSDRGAEILAAAKFIRTLRPLAHFTSVPYRHAPRAERSNRTIADGTRTTLIQAGMSEAWWAVAMLHWIAIWNGFMLGADGMTPYLRRHGEKAAYRCYPFGALVLAKLEPRAAIAENVTGKLQPRLMPCLLMEITLGPAGAWGKSYGVIPVVRFTSKKRAASTAIRRTCDVVFPETITFPLKERLSLHGAGVDRTLPAPRINDDGGWSMAEEKEDDVMEEDFYDGAWEENGPVFEKADSLQEILVLDPDVPQEDADACPEPDETVDVEFAAIEPDTKEEAALVEAVRGETVAPGGGAPPVGWRIDKFGLGAQQRLVSVPPWSRRPPSCEPEEWVGTPRWLQNEMRERWKRDFPDQFAEQEARRTLWLEAKKAGKVAKAAVIRGRVHHDSDHAGGQEVRHEVDVDANSVSPEELKLGSLPGSVGVKDVAALSAAAPNVEHAMAEENGEGCLRSLSENEANEVKEPTRSPAAERSEVDEVTANSLPAAVQANRNEVAAERGGVNVLVVSSTSAARTAAQKLRSGQFTGCLIELCCGESSVLSDDVPAGWLATRVTESADLTAKDTKRDVH